MKKPRIVWLPDGEKVWWYVEPFQHNTAVCDGQTGRRREKRLYATTYSRAICIYALRGKKDTC